ncbi:MAG: branched chain amino acid aminotransferase, partial [Gemella sp.]
GNYFKGGLVPTNFLIQDEYDRAAPNGTGAAKVGGNYAASLLPGKLAKTRHFSDVIYLDPSTHTKIEEVGSANFFGVTADHEFVTPLSPSILPSITKYSLLYLAEHRLGLTPIEGDVPIDNLDRFVEAGACGTAAVISPVGTLKYEDREIVINNNEPGEITKKLYDIYTGIQSGKLEDTHGWRVVVPEYK